MTYSYYTKDTCSQCNSTDADGEICQQVCYVWVDLFLGVIHLFMGLVGFVVNVLALYLFYKMGKQKPYYIVIVFETFTDLAVCATAFYSAVFLLSGRDSSFGSKPMLPLCILAGIVWNWNMVITPLLLSVAGLMRLHAVYWPHSAFLEQHRHSVIGLCICAYVYGVAFACFPYYIPSFGYMFKNEWSVCDFDYDKDEENDSVGLAYIIFIGPIPMFLSLLIILITNIMIVFYLVKRYKKSWECENVRSRKKGSFGSFIVNMDQKVQSKQVIISLLMMTVWYMMCYSIIIFTNFKNMLNAAATTEIINDDLGLSKINSTYFYLMYNFLAYLNSFVNPFILLTTGSSFRQELGRLSLRLRNKCGLLKLQGSHRSSFTDNHSNIGVSREKRSHMPLILEDV